MNWGTSRETAFECCPKCGCIEVDMRHTVPEVWDRRHALRQDEHLEMRCRRCRYAWARDTKEGREPEPKPAPDSGGEVEWRSRPDIDGDSVQVSGGYGLISIGASGPYAAFVSPSEIPRMARAMYQAAGLEWPGDESERLQRERDEVRDELDAMLADNNRLRSELRQARKLAPETVRLLGAAKRWEVAVLDGPAFDRLAKAIHAWQLVGCPDLPEGGE